MPSQITNPLARFRAQCGFTKERAAIAGRTRFHTIDNIERGKAPLTDAIAKALEASTGCSAKSLLRDDDPLQTVNGDVFSEGSLDAWTTREISDAECSRAAETIALRARLLIEAASAHSPALFRSAWVELGYKLEEARQNLELRFPQLEAAARANATIETLDLTRAELDKEFEKNALYISQRHLLEPRKKIQVRVESFQTWKDSGEELIARRMELINSIRTDVKIWRIQRRDGTTFDIRRPKIQAVGNFDLSQPHKG